MSQILIAPAGGDSITFEGRSYAGPAGTVVNVIDADAAKLAANGWSQPADGGSAGPTSGRPVLQPYQYGVKYSDTTLGQLVVWDGATWRNPVTGAAV